MKMLLYCTKAKPYLLCEPYMDKNKPCRLLKTNIDKTIYNCAKENAINGKIVGECDFEVEKIFYGETNENRFLYPEPYIPYDYHTNSLTETQLCYKSKLDINTLNEYLKEKNGYAIHIKNLHIFDKPRELNTYSSIKDGYSFKEHSFYNFDYKPVDRAPQNMMIVGLGTTSSALNNKYILISIKSEWLCKILNGEKTIEVRKKVLKEMMR